MSKMSVCFETSFKKLLNLDEETRQRIGRRSSSIDDLFYIGMLLRANKVHDMIEIGTFLGQSACFLAPCITGTFYSINYNPREVEVAKQTVASFDIRNIELLRGDSLEVLPELAQKVSKSLGAVYIDGNHSYKYAMGEYNIVEPYLRDKSVAVALFDDASKEHPDGALDGGVMRAVKEAGAFPIEMLDGRVAVKPFGDFKFL